MDMYLEWSWLSLYSLSRHFTVSFLKKLKAKSPKTSKCVLALFYCIVFEKTYSVTIVTSVPWDTERVLRLVKTHMGKCLFSPELKSYLITQWNCTTNGSCRCRKMNQWVGSGAARTYGDDTRQYSRRNGRGIWLYKRSFCHRILRFTSTEATTESCSYLAWQSTQYLFRISGNRGYDSNRVHSLSILHSYCVL